MSKETKLAYIVNAGWERDLTGVGTFTRSVVPDWTERFDCEVLERPIAEDGTADVSGRSSTETDKHRLTQIEKGGASESPINESLVLRSNEQSEGEVGINSPSLSGLRLALGYIKELWADIKYVKSEKQRLNGRLVVVNEFGCELLPIAIRVVCRGCRLMAIAHTHPGTDKEANKWIRRFIEKRCYRSITTVIVNSGSTKLEWEKKLRVSDLKCQVVHHGIAEPDLTIPEDYPVKEEGVVDFLCVAKFYSWKGQEQLLEAWKLALQKLTKNIKPQAKCAIATQGDGCMNTDKHECTGMRLIFVGDGARYENAVRLSAELDLSDSVVFLGAKDNGAAYFNGCDVCVLMSTEAEAFGLVLLEAMSRRKPVVASKVGGITEVVDQASSMLVDPFNTEEVAISMLSLASDKKMRVKQGNAGYDRWRKEFFLQRMLNDYKDIILKAG